MWIFFLKHHGRAPSNCLSVAIVAIKICLTVKKTYMIAFGSHSLSGLSTPYFGGSRLMTLRELFYWFTFAMTLLISPTIQAQEMANKPGQNVTEMKFTNVPGLPTCTLGSVQNGDPTKGPSIIFAQIDTGCVIPWHWHTSSEHLMMVSGIARIEM